MRKIGYARVSSQHQNLDRQVAALRAEGAITSIARRPGAKL